MLASGASTPTRKRKRYSCMIFALKKIAQSFKLKVRFRAIFIFKRPTLLRSQLALYQSDAISVPLAFLSGRNRMSCPASDASGNPNYDTWPAAVSTPPTNLDYFASDAWLGLETNASYTAMAGDEILWAQSAWTAPRNQNGSAEPQNGIKLTVEQVQDSNPYNITKQIDSAIQYWWEKAKIKIDWDKNTKDKGIQPVPRCDLVAHPKGCDPPNQLYDILDVTNQTTANEVVLRFCQASTPTRPFCQPTGLQLLFTRTVGGFHGVATPYGNTFMDINPAVVWNFTLLSNLAQENVAAP